MLQVLLVDQPGLKQSAVALEGPSNVDYQCCSALQVLLVDRPGLKQSTVALGEPGVHLRDPDAPALDVLTSVLNNFGGRLFNQIRSREVRTFCCV